MIFFRNKVSLNNISNRKTLVVFFKTPSTMVANWRSQISILNSWNV